MKHKVLCDLALGHISKGFSGIPQDTRLLFNGLSTSQSLDVSGLLLGVEQDVFNFKTADTLAETAVFLGDYLNNVSSSFYDRGLLLKILHKFFPRVSRYLERYQANKVARFTLTPVDSRFFLEIIWRNFFAQTLSPSDRPRLLANRYYWAALSIARIMQGVQHTLPSCYLSSDHFDFVIFQDSRYVKLPPQTQPIIRYHDALPVFSADTVNNHHHTLSHIRGIKACAKDSIYVCNSSNSLDELAEISPLAADNARVIPYFLPTMKKPTVNYSILKNICATRRSSSSLAKQQAADITEWFANQEKIPAFVMSLATLEPRKNFIGLINAWSILRYQTGRDIKLMIVGKPGWKFNATLQAMRPFVESGDLIHLENVAQHELPYLYAAADCFVFPSVGEGFGLPPNEAMQCDCPVAVSDIPAHRYSTGDAALYFDPYDNDAMAHQMSRLLDTASNATMRKQLIKKGHANVKRYSQNTVLPLWEKMFDELNHGK